eukprot:g5835.t1
MRLKLGPLSCPQQSLSRTLVFSSFEDNILKDEDEDDDFDINDRRDDEFEFDEEEEDDEFDFADDDDDDKEADDDFMEEELNAEEEEEALIQAANTEEVQTTEETSEVAEADFPVGCPEGFILNFLWLDRVIAISVDQTFGKDQRSPLTDYFIWPETDAWEELHNTLNKTLWISESDKICLLNRTTEVINYWQEEDTRRTLEEAQETFPDCVFMGA